MAADSPGPDLGELLTVADHDLALGILDASELPPTSGRRVRVQPGATVWPVNARLARYGRCHGRMAADGNRVTRGSR